MGNLFNRSLSVGLGIVAAGISHYALAGNQYIYAGIMPTYAVTNFDWTNADTGADSNPDANGQVVLNNTDSTTQVGTFLGYGVLLDRIYLGIEGSLLFGNRSATSTTTDFNNQMQLNNKLTMNDIYMIDFRPGYILFDKNSMIYGVIGLNTANFEAEQSSSTAGEVTDSGPMRENGIRIGLGYNLGLGEHFMARVEYVYTKFQDFQFTDTFPDGSETHTWDINPDSNEISVGLAAVFNI
jgi:opacity protein-like surface antigen